MDIEAPNTPNTGRIIDVWLGGSHHFPLDAAAAAGFERAAPVFPAMFRELRAFTERAVRFVHAQGVHRFLVLGAGIPSQGNVHNTVPEANVLYTDIDAHNIRLGQEILAGSTRAAYAHCDASDLDTLDMALFERVLGAKEPIGVVFGGIAAFLPDDKLAASLRRLYELSPSGSYLVFDFDSDESHKHPEMLQRLMSEPTVAAAFGQDFYSRAPAAFAPLLGPWQVTEEGIVPAGAWRATLGGVPPFMWGGVAYKP